MLLEAPNENLKQRVFNLQGISFTPSQLAEQIKKHIPSFEIEYQPDFRQNIADSWPNSLDDTNARDQWGWSNDYDIDQITKDMLVELSKKLRGPLQTLHGIE